MADINLKFPQTGRFIDESGSVYNVIGKYGNLKTETTLETAVYEGKAFGVSSYGSINAGQSLTMIGNTDGKYIHFNGLLISFSSGGVLLEFLENPTVVSQGSLQIISNRNRSLNISASMSVYFGGSITGGTLIFTDKPPIIPGVGQRVSSANSGIDAGWILKPSTIYAIKLTNTTSETVAFSASFGWTEL